jgi:hypothetical protein
MEFNLYHFYREHGQICPFLSRCQFWQKTSANKGSARPFRSVTKEKKMKNLVILFLLILLSHVSEAQPNDHYKYAMSGTAGTFLFSGIPYLGFLSMVGWKCDYIFNYPDKNYVPYLSTGLQAMLLDGDSYIAIPAELCYGTDRQIVSIHIGAGGILHSGGTYLQPAIFFTAHGDLRFKFGRSPIFLGLEMRLLNHYAYEYTRSGSNAPTRRTGSAVSLGYGISVGGYIR